MDEAYRKSLEALGDNEICCYLISESKMTGDRIGTCSFIPSEDGLVYDIAYCVHKNHWRNGYATEMAKGMIDYAKHHGANKITVNVNKDNTASNMIVKKLGFQVVGESTYNKSGTSQVFADYKYELMI
jgi:RimJ/RimL family protein N-acetyltransferase